MGEISFFFFFFLVKFFVALNILLSPGKAFLSKDPEKMLRHEILNSSSCFAVNSESLPNSSKIKQLLRLQAFEEKGMRNNLTPVRKTSLDKMGRIFHPLDCTGVP